MNISRVTTSILATLLIVCPFPSLVSAQSRTNSPSATSDEKTRVEIAHWNSVLTRLTVEAKTLLDEKSRPEAVVAVADAFWKLDNKRSRELFNAALDLALALESQKARDSSLRKIIVAAGKCDTSFAKDLTTRLQAKQPAGVGKQISAAALDLVSADPNAAEAIALSGARNGPSSETVSLLFELRKQDAAAANRVYAAYLANLHRDDPSQLLWLAGYPFGYHEALGGSVNPLQMSGVFGFRDEGLTPNPQLAQAFLTAASLTVDRVLEDAGAMALPQSETYRALAFFMLAYLSPHVERYRPVDAARWLSLQQNVGNMINAVWREEIAAKVAMIAASRERAARPNDQDGAFNEDLPDIEKLQISCQRDQAYAHAAFRSGYKNDFKKALSIADKISDLGLRANVIQFLYFDLTLFAISPKSLGGLDEGLAFAQRVNAPDQRGLLYLRLAEFAAKTDSDRARIIFSDVLKTCDLIEDRTFRAALLFASAYNLATLDATFLESFTILEKAIRLLNEDKEIRIDRIRLLRRVNLGCTSADPSWYGDGSDVGEFNLIETLVRISEKDWRMAEELATELPEGLNRTRSLAAVAKSRLNRLSGGS